MIWLICFAAGTVLALVIWGVLMAIRFARGPMPVPEYVPESPWLAPIRQERPQRERFSDLDCRTDFDVQQEARRLHRQAVERSGKAWLN